MHILDYGFADEKSDDTKQLTTGALQRCKIALRRTNQDQLRTNQDQRAAQKNAFNQ